MRIIYFPEALSQITVHELEENCTCSLFKISELFCDKILNLESCRSRKSSCARNFMISQSYLMHLKTTLAV